MDSIDALKSRIKSDSHDDSISVRTDSDSKGSVRYSIVCPFGDITHTIIERNNYPRESFLPGWRLSPLLSSLNNSIWAKLPDIDLQNIDHVAINQPIGSLAAVSKWYVKCSFA